MKNSILLFVIVMLSLATGISFSAENKTIVIPLNSKAGPGNWKHVSVSSLGGISRTSMVQTPVTSNTCGAFGRYANNYSANEFLTVPIQLPDGATIVSFTGLFCDNTALYSGEMILYRSDTSAIAHVMTLPNSVTSTSVISRTDTTILPGTEIVDNSRYSYIVYMSINGNEGAGSALYPVGAVVTLQ